MLAQIRHIQKGTLIVVTGVVVIAFAFLYSDFDFVRGTVGTQECVVRVYDRCYRQKEAQKLATNFDVAVALGMYEFAFSLFGENRRDRDPTDFILSLIILRKEAERLGIEPSAQEIKEAIPTLPVFQRPNVTAEMIQNNVLGPNGFSDGDLAQLVKDYLSYSQLRELIGSGIQAVPVEVQKRYISQNQQFTAKLIEFDRSKYLETLKVTEEDIKEYYEANKDSLLSDEKRGFSYVHFIPEKLPEDATNEQKAKKDYDFANAVNHAYADLAEGGADFDAIVSKLLETKPSFQVKSGSYEPFSRNSPPEEVGEDSAMLASLFSAAAREGNVSVPFEQPDGSYFVFRFSKKVAPTGLKLEEAREGIITVLKDQKSDQAASEAANAALAKLKEAMGKGKSIEDAAKEAGVELISVPVFSSNDPPAGVENPSLIVDSVQGLSSGEFSEVSERPEARGYFVTYVEKIEIYKDDQKDQRERSIKALAENEVKRSLFTAWLNQKRFASESARAGQAAQSVKSNP